MGLREQQPGKRTEVAPVRERRHTRAEQRHVLDQEREAIRSPQAWGVQQVVGGGDLQRFRQERQGKEVVNAILVCARVTKRLPPAPSEIVYCTLCAAACWRASSSPTDATVVCAPCALHAVPANVEIMVTDRQREEMREQGITDADIEDAKRRFRSDSARRSRW
jgi:hypothetical protein